MCKILQEPFTLADIVFHMRIIKIESNLWKEYRKRYKLIIKNLMDMIYPSI